MRAANEIHSSAYILLASVSAAIFRLFLCGPFIRSGNCGLFERRNSLKTAQQLLDTPLREATREREVLDSLRIVRENLRDVRTWAVDHSPIAANQIQLSTGEDSAFSRNQSFERRGCERVEDGIAQRVTSQFQVKEASREREEI